MPRTFFICLLSAWACLLGQRALAFSPAAIDSSYRLSAVRTDSTIELRIHWARAERDKADLALELIDLDGTLLHTYRQKIKLSPNTDATARFSLKPVAALGLDSSRYYFVVSANLSCNCEDLHRVLLAAEPDAYDWPDPQLHLSVRRHNRKQYIVLQAQNLAKDVVLRLAKPHPTWQIEETHLDVLPGQEQEIEVMGLLPSDILRPEDVEADWRR